MAGLCRLFSLIYKCVYTLALFLRIIAWMPNAYGVVWFYFRSTPCMLLTNDVKAVEYTKFSVKKNDKLQYYVIQKIVHTSVRCPWFHSSRCCQPDRYLDR